VDNSTSWDLLAATLFFALRQVNFKEMAYGSVFLALTKTSLQNLEIDWVTNPNIQKLFLTLLNDKE